MISLPAGRGGRSGRETGIHRRYLIVPGLRSSRISVLDTKDDPRNPTIVKEIPASELAAKADYSRPHTIHCGPDGIYVSALGSGSGAGGPGGIAVLDHTTFDVRGQWESDRGDQFLRTTSGGTSPATCWSAPSGFIVYEFVGVKILRRAWFNMDRVWAGVMVGAGALTIALTA